MPGSERWPASRQAREVVDERLVVALRPLGHLERGEPVDVDAGHGRVDRLRDVDVVVAVEVGMDSALETHLGGPDLGRLDGSLGDVVEGQQIRRAPQVERQGPLENPQNRHLKVHTLV